MYTATELLSFVRNRQEIPQPDSKRYFDEVILDKANHGWLCLNTIPYGYLDDYAIRYYESLGYTIDKSKTIYWLYT